MSKWDMSDKTRDSLQFEKTHHYTLNYNFKVNADSLLLYKQFQEEGTKLVFHLQELFE